MPLLDTQVAIWWLAVSDTHAIETAALPRHHDDPFDRMLIAQTRVERMRAASAPGWKPDIDRM